MEKMGNFTIIDYFVNRDCPGGVAGPDISAAWGVGLQGYSFGQP